jgi:protein O-GlcNAc transferase
VQDALRLIDEGNAIEDKGRLNEALRHYENAIRLAPHLAKAHLNRGNALLATGDIEGALGAFATAISKDHVYAPAHYNKGMAYARAGRHADARLAFETAIALEPGLADAQVALGCSLEELGELDTAAASYRRALGITPERAEVHCNLANVLRSLGRLDDAASSYRRAVKLKPDFAAAHYSLGRTLQDIGKPGQAEASYRRALEVEADMVVAHFELGNALLALGRVDEAVASYGRAVDIDPSYAEAHCNLGNALASLGRLQEAISSYRQALQLKPEFELLHFNLGTVLQRYGSLVAAVASYRRAVELRPDYVEAHNNLGSALQGLGQMDGAVESYEQALSLRPDTATTHSNLLFCFSHREAIDGRTLFAQHCRFGERFESPLRAGWPQHVNVRDSARALRIGFVSADLRDHVVARFIEPLLVHLSRSAGLLLHAYYNHATEDDVSARLRGYFKHWQRIAGLSDAAVAQGVADDGIDILIDLSGHTAENRLQTFARKPAPVQVSWIGYPGTTGLKAMDYYLADRSFLPPGEFDSQFTEKLVYLPANAPFMPDKMAPAVNALPALRNRHVTFGSFNRISKLSRSAIALWAQLMRALPDSRMILGGLQPEGEYDWLIDRFAQEGIVRERLTVYHRCSSVAYHALHHHVDLCLDTVPYTGGTTTNHALWMGVPTLTLAGNTPPGRQGAAVLGFVGLDAFVTKDAAEFQRKGLFWAGNLAALAAIREGLRARCEQSPICGAEVIAMSLESALRSMWRRWCAGLPPETFVVGSQGADSTSSR